MISLTGNGVFFFIIQEKIYSHDCINSLFRSSPPPPQPFLPRVPPSSMRYLFLTIISRMSGAHELQNSYFISLAILTYFLTYIAVF
ncbi:hypothetical protein M434DRAFT_277306 [Hypoxylon sp. CO27-5]|nr:hypothetical protein M434DRAFT_277306 [Hypoxylon sp. CO27-5]